MTFAALSVIAAGTYFTCTPTAVWDGDGPIWCAEGPRLRLAGIASREIDNSCRAGHPCPSVSGIVARNTLVRLLGGARGKLSEGHVTVGARPMRCLSDGSTGGSRTAAWCVTASGIDLNCAMIRSGSAVRWHRYWRQHHC